jgi:allantoinase
MNSPPRDFIGYGMHPPNPQWPGGAYIAVNIVVNYHIGAEKNVVLGDDAAGMSRCCL